MSVSEAGVDVASSAGQTAGPPARRPGMVVVGIDGSAPSRNALRYALAEASRRGAGVRLVWAYDPSERRSTGHGAGGRNTSASLIGSTVELGARAWRMVAGLAGADPRLASVPVEIRVLAGPAAGVLLAAARDADLVVIGRRSRSGLAKALLGPVGLHCALRSEVPVVIVPADAPASPAGANSRTNELKGTVRS
ncbi:universal stress protein [Pseudonocardia acaciae]|uniref:universal stress protein n=1 Tax=Pseudonocardia acaciae TaxID=551276 RepID=UPI0006885D23|nr:universal stress protein [Pseudonocardia acaciae]